MEQIELCMYFKQGMKKLDIMLCNGKATFKHCTDIIKFKFMLDSWIDQNLQITEATYTDYLQKIFCDHKNKPFTYSNVNQEANGVRRGNLTSKSKNQKLIDKTRIKAKNKIKQHSKSPKRIIDSKNTNKKNIANTDRDIFDTYCDIYTTDEGTLRVNQEDNNDLSKYQNDNRSVNKRDSVDSNSADHTKICDHQITPIIKKEQLDKKPETSDLKTRQNSANKTPICNSIEKNQRQSVKNTISNDIYCDKFYDEFGRLHYKGQVVNDQANGFGTQYFVETGNIEYTGQFNDNLLHGCGTLFDQLGNKIYYGEFVGGVRSGIGVEYYASSGLKFYEGQWQNDMWNGWGKVWNQLCEIEYEGKVANNKPSNNNCNILQKRNENSVKLETNLETIKEAKLKAKDNTKKIIKKKTKKPKKVDKENIPLENIVIRQKSIRKKTILNTDTSKAINNTTNCDQNSQSSKVDYDLFNKNNISMSEETKIKYSDQNSCCKDDNVSNKNLWDRIEDCLGIEVDSKIQENATNLGESSNFKNTLEETPYDEYSSKLKNCMLNTESNYNAPENKKESLLDTTEQNFSMKANVDIISMQNTSYEYNNKNNQKNVNFSPINDYRQIIQETGVHEGSIYETNSLGETQQFTSTNLQE